MGEASANECLGKRGDPQVGVPFSHEYWMDDSFTRVHPVIHGRRMTVIQWVIQSPTGGLIAPPLKHRLPCVRNTSQDRLTARTACSQVLSPCARDDAA